MGYLTITPTLSFDTLRAANAARLKHSKYSRCEDDWTPAHWMQATVGELGELANLLKKVDRGDFTLEEAREEISKEFADVQTYLDIMAMKLGVNLARATKDKFNEVSDRIGSSVYIDDDDDWHIKPGST
ncbi:MAG: MazG-like family protein [Candidatus Thiodiazotropha endolucinida]